MAELIESSKTKLKAATAENLAQIVLEISEALVSFTAGSDPVNYSDWDEIQRIEQLDALADKTRQSITADSIESSIKMIMDSSSQLNQLIKKLKSEAERNKQSAQKIRLKPVIDVVDSMSSAITKLKEARDSLSSQDSDKNIGEQISSVVEAFNGLDKAIKAL
ncbi:MAG: hypothetical protein KJ717_11425 [Proteobacteria bacterium]|nr:hypothetical protein [Pseudomonadota bacterium]